MALKSCGIGAALALAMLMGSMAAAGAVGVGGTCGPILNGACDPGLFCDHKPGGCELIGGTGKCVKIPTLCPMARGKPRLFLPVCGCNGTTYANNCERIKAMQREAHNGPCK